MLFLLGFQHTVLTVSSSGPSFANTPSSVLSPNTSSLYLHSPLTSHPFSQCHLHVQDSQSTPPSCSKYTLYTLLEYLTSIMLIENTNMAEIKYLIFLHLFPNHSTPSFPNTNKWYHHLASYSSKT